MRYEPVSFSDLPNWPTDDHRAALAAFHHSIHELRKVYSDLADPDDVSARAYFERHFLPHRPVHDTGRETGRGFFTGYYEPVLQGSRVRSDRFSVPLLRRPDDLETLVDDSLRAQSGDALTHARRTSDGLETFAVRQEIEEGCLAGLGLEFLYLEDDVDAFFLHVQGSGFIELDDGDCVRVGYAAKNGHPYTSIGQELIADGVLSRDEMSLQTLKDWLKADQTRGRQMMWRNKSFIFFEELGDAAAVGAVGVGGIALTAGRSLAVDASFHTVGLPVFVSVDGLQVDGANADFSRLMVAQDVGSAIRGAERGDIYFGTGPDAGVRAGTTKHPGDMFVLLPRCREVN